MSKHLRDKAGPIFTHCAPLPTIATHWMFVNGNRKTPKTYDRCNCNRKA